MMIVDGGDWVELCQTLFQSVKEEEWTAMHERLKEATKKITVQKAGQMVGVQWLGGRR